MHAVVIEESLRHPSVLHKYQILKTKVDESWHLHVIYVNDWEKFIQEIQGEMISGNEYYFHLYDEDNLIVAYRDKFFKLDPFDKTTWKEAIEHGKKLAIKDEFLDFYPSHMGDEHKWIKGE